MANTMLKETLDEGAIQWLATGEHGASSKSIFSWTTGVPVGGRIDKSYPHDPDDLRRCLHLLEDSPLIKANFAKMRVVSCIWADFCDQWDKIAAMFEREAPNWRNKNAYWVAPKTYELMREIQDRHYPQGNKSGEKCEQCNRQNP